ncbi:hypothetical protein Lbir_2442 [Legionella birminghamensis]|uniref:Uncharacterized protein n=1 Tax=Legionella birminghamensis TaxID=28083 RepID=A0A378I9G1_9GAMM|nr:hypothetical protein [Legionella birminghamensis]KTC68909.1 hypothetical protein Lbir_2442 [Legionella birminghamensis]STX31425.1 Uncharacterised protein [Legionella birminghamensis]
MAELSEVAGLTRKVEQLIKQRTINGFPDNLSRELEETAALLKEKECPLNESLHSLLIRLHLLSISLLKDNSRIANEEKLRIAKNIIACTHLIRQSNNEPENIKYHKQLRRLLNSNAFECRKYTSPWAHYPLAIVDSVVNAVNYGRAGIFRTDYARSRFATKDYISENLEHFTLVNRSNTSRLILSCLRPVESAPTDKELTSHLNIEITNAFGHFTEQNKEKLKLCEEMTALVAALNAIAKQLIAARHNQVIYNAGEKAFLACQDLVLELLGDKKISIEKIRRLTACFNQTARVIQNPGNKEEVIKLSDMVEKSDYSRYQADREKTSYAVIHILVSAALLGLAIFEAVASHGLSMAVHAWIISAEGASLGVGLGQLYYFSNSEQRKTLFFDSMDKMCRASRLASSHDDWTNQSDLANRRTALLNEVNAAKFNDNTILSDEVSDLFAALEALQKSIHFARHELLQQQAEIVLSCAQDLALDLLRADKPSLKRIQKLRQAVNAAQKVIEEPGNPEAIHRLTKIIHQASYEDTRVIKRDIAIAFLLALSSLVLFAVTIAGTILSGGGTAGTILSPFMLMIMSINRLIHAFQHQKTSFREEAQKLSDYSELMGDMEETDPDIELQHTAVIGAI